MKLRALILVFLMGVLTSVCSVAEEPLNIPADIKPILQKEMLAVEKGMQELVSSIAKGDWDKTVAIGKQIQASYIMKQSLTPEQMKQLHHSLPKQFIKQDHAFHQYAGMLAHAAEVKNLDVMNFYFYKMNESCVQCHSRYAQERFPTFATQSSEHSPHKH
jgi:cytochrome c556